MTTRGVLVRFLLLLATMILMSCATAAEKDKMVPYIDYSAFTACGHTLKISEIKGGEETTGEIPKIGNKSFQDALVDTLRKSGLFTAIYTDQTGDYELRTEIVSQKVEPGMTAFAALFVNYRLIETGTNHAVWTENIFSQNDAFGANHGKDVLEGVARDNLAQMVRKLASILNQQNRK